MSAAITPPSICRELLENCEPDIVPIREKLADLSQKYRLGGEERIGWEILNAVRALDETIKLSKLYLSKTPLPTIDEIREIYKQYGHNPDHFIGTCVLCGKEMVFNVPRLGPGGGYVHKVTGKFMCG